jgi:hypothetical protein
MNPTPKKELNATLSGKIIGSNNSSGLLYITQNGLAQFKPKKNVIPPPVSYSNYRNDSNTNQTLEEMNSKKGNPPNFYKGSKSKIIVKQEDKQPHPFTVLGGKTQQAIA